MAGGTAAVVGEGTSVTTRSRDNASGIVHTRVGETMDSPDEVGNLVQRVDRLERQNRLLKWHVVALLLLGATVLLTAQRPSRVVAAERFVLRDAQGVEYGVLEASLGTPRLELHDRNSQRTAEFGLNGMGGVSLTMENRIYERKATLSIEDQSDGAAKLVVDGGPLAGTVSAGASSAFPPALQLQVPPMVPLHGLVIATDTAGAMLLTDLGMGMHKRKL